MTVSNQCWSDYKHHYTAKFLDMNPNAPLLPIFNCKKRSREAIIAEPQEQFVSSSHDGNFNNLEYPRNNITSQPAGSLYDNQMYHQDSSVSHTSNMPWSNDQPQINPKMNNNSSRYQFHHRAPEQCNTMQVRMSDSNPNSYSQPRNNQRKPEVTANMDLIPPNPPNPKAARYSVNQRSVCAEGQSQYLRPSGRESNFGRVSANKAGLLPNPNSNQGYGRNSGNFNNIGYEGDHSSGSNATGQRQNTNSTSQGYGRNNGYFNRTSNTTGHTGYHSSSLNAMGQRQNAFSSQGYNRNNGNYNRTSNTRAQDRGNNSEMYRNSSVAMSHGVQNQWNSGSGYTMPFNGSGGDSVPEQWNQWGDGGRRQPMTDMMGISPSMDRRYRPIDSSFQMPSATGDGALSTNTNMGQLLPKTAATPRMDTHSKTEVKSAQKPVLDRSLRIIATDLGGIKNWEQLRGMLSFLFEIYAQVNSATVKVPDTDAKKFNIKEGEASMDCIFYEIDHSLPKLTRGKLYRIVGSFDSHQNVIKCVSVREALPEEYTTHQSSVQRCVQYKLELSNLAREQ